ncbi:BA14K family protein [Rhizobium sp. J15]|uniref:BA14K family protein n=1 Tax=Rhizobium sp. J15 TaxID=2035450 RepID=UPI000BEAC8FC|nr:BA14K family protein [Rhizobium sp. J15]PDT15836.1 BA14K family protein [Rhizobium sp. J15]
MKAIASVAFGIVSSVGACIAAASVASHVVADSEPHTFNDLASPDLWTTKPVKIDPRRQQYERIAPLYSSYVTEAPAVVASRKAPQYARPPAEARTSQPKLPVQHLAWCRERYRSFDPGTNSYRSYSGETRECLSPFQQTVAAADGRIGVTVDPQAAAWCAARYRSYRPEDNTYQPWDGPRRVCTAPNIAAEIVAIRN